MIENIIRRLAKQVESQNIFSVCKELSTIKLFENDKNLSRLQHIYLSYLFFYNDLNMDIALKKVSEKVLDSEIYEDAYSYYKRNKKEEKDKSKNDHDVHLVFKRPKKRKK